MTRIKRLLLLAGLGAASVGLLVIWTNRQPYDIDASRVTERVEPNPDNGSVELLSETYTLNRVFKSMEGPSGHHRGVALLPGEPPGLVWITGVHTEVVGADGETRLPPEFFCHANLMLDQDGGDPSLDSRVLTLVPGRVGISLPTGYGIPIRSNQPLDLYSMALNPNGQDGARRVRFRTRIEFTRDTGLDQPIRPVALHALYVTERIGTTGGSFDAEAAEGSCSEHTGVNASKSGILERFGAERTIHWTVPPGEHRYSTSVTDQVKLASDTILLYATAHLHPFGKSIALRDVTTGETVLTIHQMESTGKRTAVSMEELSFPEGVPIFRDHAYELIAIYDNETPDAVDAMAILYAYLVDKDFRRRS